MAKSRECLGESRGIAVAFLESGSFQKDRGLLRGLWWEVKLGLLEVVPTIRKEKGQGAEVKDDGEGDTRAGFKRKAQSSGTVSGAATEADGSTGDRSSAWGKEFLLWPGGNLPLGRQGALERVSQEDEEERGKEGDLCWQSSYSSSLAKFSRYLGMLTEGFEGEILFLLKRMKERKLQKGVGRFLEWGAVDSRGAARGIVVIWDNRMLELVDMQKGLFSISCTFKSCEDGFYMDVYRGDFNAILRPEECSRGGSLNSIMRRFAEVIEDLELKDLPMVGGPFTWTGGADNQSFSRLDRFWLMRNGIAILEMRGSFFFPRPVSDHFPILMDSGGSFSGSASFILAEKLKFMKAKLKEWNRNSFGRVEYRKNTAWSRWSIGMQRRKPAGCHWKSWKLERSEGRI
ncbi:hypothetical protein CK203_018042 [Vitis vinifera]|uniref:DUF4283 domain-containing protein n=1 Tax=Vitis vinifera TaxID=29760 RepID=A0A438JVU9_VITVI|nr:hypothetical protein CK203_018042 [Vitis vinifera]